MKNAVHILKRAYRAIHKHAFVGLIAAGMLTAGQNLADEIVLNGPWLPVTNITVDVNQQLAQMEWDDFSGLIGLQVYSKDVLTDPAWEAVTLDPILNPGVMPLAGYANVYPLSVMNAILDASDPTGFFRLRGVYGSTSPGSGGSYPPGTGGGTDANGDTYVFVVGLDGVGLTGDDVVIRPATLINDVDDVTGIVTVPPGSVVSTLGNPLVIIGANDVPGDGTFPPGTLVHPDGTVVVPDIGAPPTINPDGKISVNEGNIVIYPPYDTPYTVESPGGYYDSTLPGVVLGNTVPPTVVLFPYIVVVGMAIETAPILSYVDGDALDLSELVVTLTYNNGSSIDVAFADFDGNGITVIPADGTLLTLDDDNTLFVSVSYDNFTADTGFLSVVPLVVTGIAIETQPTLNYVDGDKLDLSGLVVALTHNNGRNVEVAFDGFGAYGITANPDHDDILNMAHDNTPVTISCNGMDVDTDPLAVVPLAVTGLRIVRQPQLVYSASDPLDLNNLSVMLSYNNGSQTTMAFATLPGITASPAHNAPLGLTDDNKPVTVSYLGFTADTANLTVDARWVNGITIGALPNRMTYMEGNALDLTGLDVRVTYQNGTSEIVPAASFGKNITTSPIDGETLTVVPHNTQMVRVNCNGQNANTAAQVLNVTNPTYWVPPVMADGSVNAVLIPVSKLDDNSEWMVVAGDGHAQYLIVRMNTLPVGVVTGSTTYAGANTKEAIEKWWDGDVTTPNGHAQNRAQSKAGLKSFAVKSDADIWLGTCAQPASINDGLSTPGVMMNYTYPFALSTTEAGRYLAMRWFDGIQMTAVGQSVNAVPNWQMITSTATGSDAGSNASWLRSVGAAGSNLDFSWLTTAGDADAINGSASVPCYVRPALWVRADIFAP